MDSTDQPKDAISIPDHSGDGLQRNAILPSSNSNVHAEAESMPIEVNSIGVFLKVEAGQDLQASSENYLAPIKREATPPADLTQIRGGNGRVEEDGASQVQEEIVSPLQPEQSSSFTGPPDAESLLSASESESPQIQAFAKLEFDDGQFYMNTYSVILGRDTGVAKFAGGYRATTPPNVQEGAQGPNSGSGRRGSGLQRLTQEDGSQMAGNVVSESGGIVGVKVQDVTQTEVGTKRQATSSASSSSRINSRNGSLPNGYSTSVFPLMERVNANYTESLPHPEYCPLIPIHPPLIYEENQPGHRGISRKHVKIAYNFDKRLFELEVKGKNGAFLDDQHIKFEEVHELKSGSYIQIGGVGIRFVLPDVELGETGAEGTTGSEPASGGAMSFDFEDGRGESVIMANSSISSQEEDGESEQERRGRQRRRGGKVRNEEPKKGLMDPRSNGAKGRSTRQHDNAPLDDELSEEDSDDDNDNDNDDDDEEQEEEVPTSGKWRRGHKEPAKPKPRVKATAKDESPPPAKRKGPGRPPKNGVISKREQALLAKQAREAAQANAPAKPSKDTKGKLSKTIEDKDQAEALPNAKPEKRKYTKRKKAVILPDEQDDTRHMAEKTESLPPEKARAPPPPRPPKRPPKPPRSPSPIYDEASLTPEQLAKPTQSYVVLIHEALSNSPAGQMTLPQIYRAIERRYLYYRFRVNTLGWQSSVRHNLSQHSAFRKIERDGKGWMWGLVPEVSIEKEKKQRRLTPPPPSPVPRQGYYPPAHYYPPNYAVHHPPPNGLAGPYAMPPHAPMHHMPPMHPLPNYSGPPHGLPLPLAVPPLDGTGTTYRSPYDPNPPPPIKLPPSRPTYTSAALALPQQSQNSPRGPPPPSALPPNPETMYAKPPALPPNPSPTPNPAPPTQAHNPDILTAVNRFRDVLVKSMSNEPNGEQIVTNAVNRVLRKMGIGNGQDTREPTSEFPSERAIMDRLQSMLSKIVEKRAGSNTPGPPMRAPTPMMQSERKEPLEHGIPGPSLPVMEKKPAANGVRHPAGAHGEGGGATGEMRSANGEAARVNADRLPEKRGLKRAVEGDDDVDGPRESKRSASGPHPQAV